MQINTTKTGEEKVKLLKRERELLVNCGALCLQLAKHADGATAIIAENASDNLQGVLNCLDGIPCEQAEALGK